MTAAALAVVAAGLFGVADSENGEYNTFTVDKVVVGPVPDGAVFEVEVTCESIHMVEEAAGAAGVPVPAPVTMTFDDNGDPLDANMVSVPPGAKCHATETVANGAAVSYACVATPPVVEPWVTDDSATPAEPEPVECTDDQTVEFHYIAGATGTVTVTNTFEEPPPVEPPPAAAPAAAQTGVVAARPAFTG
jgi:hypothetical protein